MTTPWIVVVVLLCVLTVLNSVLLIALARYIGALVTRLPEPIALELSQGPARGSQLNRETLPPFVWEQLPWDPGETEGAELIAFLSTRCSSCLALLNDLNAFTRDHPQTRILVVISGDRGPAQRMRAAVPRAQTVIDVGDPAPAVAKAFGIDTVPFVLYYRDRVLVAKAVVNSRDMLENLINGRFRAEGDELIDAFSAQGEQR